MSLSRIHKTAETQVIPASDGRRTISVPIQINRHSGQKLITLPACSSLICSSRS